MFMLTCFTADYCLQSGEKTASFLDKMTNGFVSTEAFEVPYSNSQLGVFSSVHTR